MQDSAPRTHHGSASFAYNKSPTAHSSSYQPLPHVSSAHTTPAMRASTTTPSRIPRPSLTSPASSASYASTRPAQARRSHAPAQQAQQSQEQSQQYDTPLRATSSSSASRKRARPMSPASARSQYSSAAAISPFTPSGAVARNGAAPDWAYVTAAELAVSPPPMTNVEYELKGGMDTPSLLAARQYDLLGEEGYLGDRVGRDVQVLQSGARSDEEVLGGDRNGRGRLVVDDAEMKRSTEVGLSQQSPAGWGGYVLGALGTVVAGAWAFCRKSAFRGFHAGGGQGYHLPNGAISDDMNDSVWEDEQEESQQQTEQRSQQHTTPPCTRSFSYERLPTPIPGGYPEDSPPLQLEAQSWLSPEKRPSKRRQTDHNDWTLIDQQSDQPATMTKAPSPQSSLPTTSPAQRPTRPHLRTQSATIARRSPVAVTRHRRRISAASSSARSPSRPSSRHSLSSQSLHHHHPYVTAHQRSHSSYSPITSAHDHENPTSNSNTPSRLGTSNHRHSQSHNLTHAHPHPHNQTQQSPPTTPLPPEARKLLSRQRRAARETEQRYDRLNEQLQNMIRQGREALGSRVHVHVLDDERAGDVRRERWGEDDDVDVDVL